MEAALTIQLLQAIISTGGPYVISLVLMVAWVLEKKEKLKERKLNHDLQDKLLELSSVQVESTIKSEASINALTQMLNQVLNRM